MTVTPVRTGPCPTTSRPLPRTRVVWPSSTPATSVMASSGPAVPWIGRPRSRARGRAMGAWAGERDAARTNRVATLVSIRGSGEGRLLLNLASRSDSGQRPRAGPVHCPRLPPAAPVLLIAALSVAAGCASLQQIAALRRVDFALAGVGPGRLAGIDLGGVTSYAGLTPPGAGPQKRERGA